MKFCNVLISLAASTENTIGDKNKIRWIIEVNDLYKQHKGEARYEDQFSIVHKVYDGENLIESNSITVNRKNLFQIKDKIDMVLNECM
ncbi:MAG: hypothetical protein H0W19_05790 [Nitrosopumilus sp.]|nr:hypothetical protein [Nitrosopumilus sp.]